MGSGILMLVLKAMLEPTEAYARRSGLGSPLRFFLQEAIYSALCILHSDIAWPRPLRLGRRLGRR
jgi:hypothetical protein